MQNRGVLLECYTAINLDIAIDWTLNKVIYNVVARFYDHILTFKRYLSRFPRCRIAPKSHISLDNLDSHSWNARTNAAISLHDNAFASCIFTIDNKMQLSCCCVIVKDIRTCLFRSVIGWKKGLILDIVSSSQEVHLSSHVCEVVHKVNITIGRFPMRTQVNLHSHKVQSLLPVNLILLSSHIWHSP
jgi:hypothetical protein